MNALERAKASPSTHPQPGTLPPNADSFEADRDRIRASVSQWPHGTGATLRFLNESSGERLSLIFVDEAAPKFESDNSAYAIYAKARVGGGKVVGHLVLYLKALRPGTYQGDDHTKSAVMGILMGDPIWNAENPETAWSVNSESWCEVELRGTPEGALEGNFRARLVDNKGTGFINVESGFLFIKR